MCLHVLEMACVTVLYHYQSTYSLVHIVGCVMIQILHWYQCLSVSALHSVRLNGKKWSLVRAEGACHWLSRRSVQPVYTLTAHDTDCIFPSVTAAASFTQAIGYQWTNCCVGRETTGPRSWVIGWWEDESCMFWSRLRRAEEFFSHHWVPASSCFWEWTVFPAA